VRVTRNDDVCFLPCARRDERHPGRRDLPNVGLRLRLRVSACRCRVTSVALAIGNTGGEGLLHLQLDDIESMFSLRMMVNNASKLIVFGN
jgi:hypothetical protein